MTKSRDLGNLAQTVAVNLPTALGTAGQALVVNSGADGLEFGAASGGSGVTVYTGLSGTDGTPTGATYLLNASSPSAGDLAYVTANTSLYQNNGNGWYRIAVINTTPTISSVADASSNTTPFTLVGGTNTVITVTASDADEGTDLTYSHSVTSGSLNGTTVTQGTGASENVFTITPHASNATTFSLTFTVSDNINAATSVAAFTLEFVITDSHYTSLLMATDGSAGDNNDITDSSSSSHTITVNGDAHAGTFSPYRSGGYSTYFDGTGDFIEMAGHSSLALDTSDFTVEFWYKHVANVTTMRFLGNNYQNSTWGAGRWTVGIVSGKLTFQAYSLHGTGSQTSSTVSIDDGSWHHCSLTRSGSTFTLRVDGSDAVTYTNSGSIDGNNSYGFTVGGRGNGTETINGYISDFRLVKGTALTLASGGPTERLTDVSGTGYSTSLLTCHLPYIADGSSNGHTITVNGSTSTKPIGPYDYDQYSASTNGGSVYFDGSGDYLSYSAGNEIGFGIGDFTVEFWAYNKFSTGSLQKIIETRSASTWLIQIDSANNFIWYNNSSLFNYNISYTKDTWAHFAVTRDGTTLRLFVNGRLVSTATDSASYSVSSGTVYISRRYNDNLDYFSGYLADLRVVKGSVVTEYQTSSTTTDTQIFTPPTAPLTAITDTSLLLSGTDAHVIDKSQTYNLKLFNDAASTAALTSNSTPPYIGAAWANTSAVSFDGVDDYIDLGTAAIPTPYNEDYTFEFWMYPTSLSRRQSPIAQYAVGGAGRMLLYLNTNGSIEYYQNGLTNSGYITSSSSLISINNWYHVAVSNSNGGTRSLYVDGIRIGTMSGTQDMYTTNTTIGMTPSQAYDFTGYIQDLRITKGLARYTAADESSNIPSAPLKG